MRVVFAIVFCGSALSCLSSDGTALLTAASSGDIKTVKELISKGANPNLSDELSGLTPLSQASFNGHLDVVRVLLDAGADTKAKSKDGLTALTQACVKGHTSIAKLLLTRGADPNSRLFKQMTPLMLTGGLCQQKCAAITQILLSAGADVNAKDEEGRTALMHAPFFGEAQVRMHAVFGEQDGDLEVATVLVQAGANIHEEDKNGMTALKYAEKQNRRKLAAMLRKAGAKQ